MGEYYKTYTIPEFMQVYYELSESEVNSFKVFCESKGKSDKEGITSVLTVLLVLSDLFYKIHNVIFDNNTRCQDDEWFQSSVYHSEYNNFGIVPPANCKYWIDELRYFFNENGNFQFIDLDVRLINTDINFSQNPEYYIRYIKFLLGNRSRLVKDIKSLAVHLQKKYPEEHIARLERFNNPECNNMVRDLLYNKKSGFRHTVDILQLKGFSAETILSALKSVLGEAQIKE